MSFWVLDASFVFPWLFEDEATTAADDMLALVEAHGAVVPTLWHTGIANGLGMAERRNRITPSKARGQRRRKESGCWTRSPWWWTRRGRRRCSPPCCT